MPPSKIMLIRHAEKQTNGSPAGVDENGTPDKHSLIPRGWERAGALVPLFRGQIARSVIAQPTAIFAAAFGDGGNPVLVDGEDVRKSRRPQQTVAPLARALAIGMNIAFAVGAEAEIANTIVALDGIVLVAWEHKHLPAIAGALSDDAPPAWPGGDVFDIIWILDRSGESYAFASAYQAVLDGDTPAQTH